jgi:hypothetical protein
MSLLVKQLFDSDTCTYTYLLIDEVSRDTVIIDGVFSNFARDARYIEELSLNLQYSVHLLQNY